MSHCYTVDPDDLYFFLDQHKSSRVSSGQDPTAQLLSYRHNNAHYAPSLMMSEVERPRIRRREPSSSSGGTIQSSTFDPSDTISSVSTAPQSTTSRRRRDHERRPSVPMPQDRSSRLVCEFFRYSKCHATFDPNDVEGWIKHNAKEHLKKEYPMYSICWFCDGYKFQAISDSRDDRRQAYNDRMRHIAGHFHGHDSLTGHDMRPDFFFLNHLNDNNLISRRAFEKAKAKTEVPKPNDMELYPAGSRPPRQTRAEMYPVAPPGERYRVLSDGRIVYLQ